MNESIEYEDILLAEDDADDTYFFTIAMETVMASVKLRFAEDGEKLFHELEAKIPELLFLDIHMPCKDGIECIQEIRQNRNYDRMPVIMYSSASFYVERSYRLGANYFVEKPANLGELEKKLRRILSIDWKKSTVYPSFDQYVV